MDVSKVFISSAFLQVHRKRSSIILSEVGENVMSHKNPVCFVPVIVV